MKKFLFCLLLFFLTSLCSYPQTSEFTYYSNGLIYSPETMGKLKHIVDSLNLKFKTCDLSQKLYSLPQGKATYFSGIKRKEAINAIKKGINLDEFLRKFPNQKSVKDLHVIKASYTTYNDGKRITYFSLPIDGRNYDVAVKDTLKNDIINGWVFSETGGEMEALFLDGLSASDLPSEYSRMVSYVDCMVDSAATIFLKNAKSDEFYQEDKNSSVTQFINWATTYPKHPIPPSYDENMDLNDTVAYTQFDNAYLIYKLEYKRWDSLRLLNLDMELRDNFLKLDLLRKAMDEALVKGNSNDQLEFYIARYISKETALELKRRRKVMGFCSMDTRPRDHAMNICLLSAETAKWDIFLRSHLDIMNDRFDRMSDGSYAWKQRQTYLRELEELDINVLDLLLGTCFKVSNIGDNHYYGNIGRIGRALAESKDQGKLESYLYSLITDQKLDLYNRLIFAYLFNNYQYNLEDAIRKTEAQQMFFKALEAMPKYVQDNFKSKKKFD